MIEARYDFKDDLERFTQLQARAVGGEQLEAFEIDYLASIYRLVRAYQEANELDTYTDQELIDVFTERVEAQVNPGDFCILDNPK